MLIPDIIADLKFYPTKENGRKSPTPSTFFACTIVIDNKNHDARLLLDDIGGIAPGDFKKNVPIKFLCPDLVIPKLKVGSHFFIRDGKIVGEGNVVTVINEHPESSE